jgi:CHAD domain-containing protein
MSADGKWIDGLHRDTPAVVAARRVIEGRLKAVQIAREADPDPGQEVEHLHKLRVSTRRAAAALRLFSDWCDPDHLKRVRRQLRRIRRAASDARRCDVQLARLEHEPSRGTPTDQQQAGAAASPDAARVAETPARAAGERLIQSIREERSKAGEAVDAAGKRYPAKRLRRARRALLKSLCPHSGAAAHASPFAPGKQPYTLVELAVRELPALADSLTAVSAASLRKI